MRNSRRVNTTLTIAIVGIGLVVLLLPAMPALGAMPQESINNSNPSTPRNQNVEVELLQSKAAQELADARPTQATLSDAKEDKWALDDDDRMTDDELNKELFGDDDSTSESGPDSLELSNEDNESGSQGGDESDTDREDERDENQESLPPVQTIESFLKNINSVTIDTRTPPSNSREGIDVPTMIVPPMMSPANRNFPLTDIWYQTPDIHHSPLYFEDRAAERAGVVHHLRQPIISARKFTGDVLTLPGKFHQARPRSCEYHQSLRYSHPSLIRN